MHKHKYYKPPKPSTLPQKPIDMQSRPQFITDFSDPDKYKLSQLEMIQKKAALQSKNREAARQSLQERRKKLQMGIIDQQTRKIFETALTSKRIDINPTMRRNLSQMIQYERQRSGQKNKGSASKSSKQIREEENSQEQNQSQGFQKEIKKTQHFIKKLERAKKQENIGKAVDIILNDKKSSNFGPTKSMTNILNGDSSKSQNGLKGSMEGENNISQSRMSSMSQQQTLSNIEQTIKFMQEKLFNPNWNKNKNANENKNELKKQARKDEDHDRKTMQDIKCSTISEISHNMTQNQFLSGFNSGRQTGHLNPNLFASPNSDFLKHDQNQQPSFDMQGHLAALKLNFNKNTNLPNFNFLQTENGMNSNKNSNKNWVMSKQQQQDQQDDCMATIRKMKDMMQSKANVYDNSECHRQKQNNLKNYNTQKIQKSLKSDGDVEVDFSLTLNQDQIMQNNSFSSPQIKINPVKKPNNYLDVPQHQNNVRKTGIIQQTGYQEMKKSLFDQIDRLEEQSKMTSSKITSNMSRITKHNQNHIIRCDDQDQDQQCSYDIPIQYQFKKKQQTNQNNNKYRAQLHSSNTYEQQQWPEAQSKNTYHNSYTNASSSNFNIMAKSMNVNKAPQLQVTTVNKELEQLKNLVQGTKKNVNSISIAKSGVQTNSRGMMGFDYRGSINIKKHVVQNQQ